MALVGAAGRARCPTGVQLESGLYWVMPAQNVGESLAH
jgi:hypothetical protein